MGKYNRILIEVLSGQKDNNINIQPKGSKAKAYQVKQIRQFLTYNKIGLGDEDV
ncbi:MAG: hypothetical protein J5829_05875 [Lachnospiraceae bacterium]|nr:hypothetical protein [Lachnospiraceae bacterium]